MSVRLLVRLLAAACLPLLLSPSLFATQCAIDPVPAATLLVPYFEVDVSSCPQRAFDTTIRVGNVTNLPALAHVTVWSDLAVPVLIFDVYLPGFSFEEFALGRILCDGFLPSTGSAVSPLGPFSVFGTFPGCNSTTMVGDPPVYGGDGALTASQTDELRRLLRGLSSPISGLCAGQSHGDLVARGYVTIDNTTACNLNSPADTAYYTNGYLSLNNQLVGSAYDLNSAGAIVRTRQAAAMEADASMTGIAGGPTFYGRYNATILGFEYSDGREPLPTTFSAPFQAEIGGFNEFAAVNVWREATNAGATFACNTKPAWYPLVQFPVSGVTSAISADNQVEVVSTQSPLFPLATQHVMVSDLTSFTKGWLRLALASQSAPVASNSFGQAWVEVVTDVTPNATPNTLTAMAAHPLDGQCPAPTNITRPEPMTLNPG